MMDTRNKAWADDKTKFGYRMLQKMGWSEGKGLGIKEDGITEHIKLKKRATSAGIGTDPKSSDVWKVPGQVATNFNDILSRVTSATPDVVKPPRQQTKVAPKSANNFYKRRTANKSVSAYTDAQIREIFGGAVLPTVVASATDVLDMEPAGEGVDNAKSLKLNKQKIKLPISKTVPKAKSTKSKSKLVDKAKIEPLPMSDSKCEHMTDVEVKCDASAEVSEPEGEIKGASAVKRKCRKKKDSATSLEPKCESGTKRADVRKTTKKRGKAYEIDFTGMSKQERKEARKQARKHAKYGGV